MPDSERCFSLEVRRTRWFSGYNSNLHELTGEVQAEVDQLLARSGILQNAPFRAIDMCLQFSDYICKPKIHFIDKKTSSVSVEAAVDWREHAKDGREELKNFLFVCVADCIAWLFRKYSLSAEAFGQIFGRDKTRPTRVAAPEEELVESIVRYANALEIGIKLSDDDFGTEAEIEPCQKFAMELSEYGEEQVGTLVGGGFYRIYVPCDQPVQVYRQIAQDLKNKKLRGGSYAEAHYLEGNLFNHDRFDFT